MDYSLTVIILILSLFTFFIPAIARKLASRRWRLVYLLPLILSVLLAPFIGWDIGNLGVYIAALLIMGELFTDQRKLRTLLSGAAVVSVLASLVFMSVSPLYHKAQYLEDFEKAFATMKEHYVLTEEKAIDWDALYGKYRPLFAEAEKEQDEYLCNASWTKFAQEFYDGHVA
ncbi:MAG: hypothetical protein IKO11_00670, partial [Lachnospiraceae bacterium]|nr:hypothetical protein [Lachnospiraceae bacterium]